MGAEVALLSRMILWIDEDRVVRTGSHAGFAADTNRFIEIDDAVRALKHCGRRTSGHARRVRALVAACYLVRAAHLWKHAHIDVLDIRACDANRHDILRLARGRAGMTTDAARVVCHL